LFANRQRRDVIISVALRVGVFGLKNKKGNEMLRKLFVSTAISALLVGLVVLASAQDKSVSLTGPIVDKMCSARVGKAADVTAAAAAHKKDCALSDACAASGFGVFADGKYYEFDAKGNEMAKAKLEASKKDAGAKFKVEGKLAENKLTVTSISEVE
jgi:hypothetical protein